LKLNFDKSPGDDGITNRMIKAEGPRFEKLLHQLFGILWQHEIRKLCLQHFEGILISRLTKLTKTHSTLTGYQFQTRPGR